MTEGQVIIDEFLQQSKVGRTNPREGKLLNKRKYLEIRYVYQDLTLILLIYRHSLQLPEAANLK